MRYALLLLALSAQAATLTIEPLVIYDCTGTVGKATVRWKDASGPVQVLVGSSQAVFTGLSGTSGSAETGTWVGDGLEFRLVNQKGEVEALTTAHVECDARVPANGLVSESYFPLQVGNRWIYKTDSRFVTSDYVIWTITGMKRVTDRWYSEVTVTRGANSSVVGYYREEAGIVYALSGTPEVPREDVYLNAALEQHAPFANALGSYPDAAFQTLTSLFNRSDRVFVKGVGLVRSNGRITTGSNGGFSDGIELVEFRMANGVHVEPSVTSRVSLSAPVVFDVTGRDLTNCAIPCYYAACGLGSPVDPPGTYKPCGRVRLEAAAEGDFQVELTLTGPTGELYRAPALTGSGEAVRYVQMPLYGEGNKLFPAGKYTLLARVKNSRVDLGTAQIIVEIR
ncbi:MAG: hypothetical protein ABIR70_18970 [Bryobacteraceae bacterium]